MAQHVAVVFVHGINVRKADYHVPMRNRLVAKIPAPLRRYVKFQSVFWADLVRDRQHDYMLQAQSVSPIKDTSFRRLIVEGLGDAAAYQKTSRSSVYNDIQARLWNRIADLDHPEYPNRPLIFIGHSLGCHIISSYAWDINTIKQLTNDELANANAITKSSSNYLRAATPFQRLDTFAGFVTLGSNMPLFTFSFPPHNVFPISRSRGPDKEPAFPGRGLDPVTKERVRWLNFYSPNDLLGYPLKPLNEYYGNEERLSDIAVRSEGLMMSFVPSPLNTSSAHLGYWRNKRVIKDTAELIEHIATARDGENRARAR